MNSEQTFLDTLKYQYKYGGMTIKLIAYNLIVFLILGLNEVISTLTNHSNSTFSDFLFDIFTLNTDFNSFLHKPWAIFTSIFAHFGLMHFLGNMLMLYFSGKAFEQLFDEKRLIYTYIIGGVFGGIFELLAHATFPVFENNSQVIVGASGSVMAIFTAIAFYRPNMEVKLFGVFSMKIIYLALIFIAIDLFSLGAKDGTAHFAHVGGIAVGYFSTRNIYSNSNIIVFFQNLISKITSIFKSSGKPKMKVKRGSTRSTIHKTDEEYLVEAKERQEKIDKILDKISKSGYESLTKTEKDFLFKQSQNGK